MLPFIYIFDTTVSRKRASRQKFLATDRGKVFHKNLLKKGGIQKF